MASKTTLPTGKGDGKGKGMLGDMRSAENAHLSMPTAPKRRKARANKANDEGLVGSLCTLICEHQMGRPWKEADLTETHETDYPQVSRSTCSLSSH